MNQNTKPLIIAGLSGGSGKTLSTLSLIAHLRQAGYTIMPFKKGPDFIDPAWLTEIAGRPCRNLDAFLMSNNDILRSFKKHGGHSDVCIVEGNRGLFDGVDDMGSYSTARLAKLIGGKVILVLDATKMTSTAGALVMGCQNFDPQLEFAGVILNRTGGERHIRVVTRSIEKNTGLRVLGSIPKLKEMPLFERHLGLMPVTEHQSLREVHTIVNRVASQYLNAALIRAQVSKANFTKINHPKNKIPIQKYRVGVILDRAFNFYYPENFEALENEGAELIFLNAETDKSLPDLDALYIGGGFPETIAPRLKSNLSFRRSIKQRAEQGLRIFAECGGAVYLGRSLTYKGIKYPMTGVFDADYSFSERPCGHGYTKLKIVKPNPFFKTGSLLKGHEFHYTFARNPGQLPFVAKVLRGEGFGGAGECLVKKNVFASYTHIHGTTRKDWAKAMLRGAD